MSASLRLWIAVLALTSFLAGLAGGIVFGLELRPEVPERGPFSDYEQLLVERFDLSPERARGLHVVLEQYRRQIENLKDKNSAVLEPELVRLGQNFRAVVRDTVLPAEAREEFQRLSSGGLDLPRAL